MTRPSANIALVILAAGASRRMGKTTKQLLQWKNTTLLGNAIAVAEKSNTKNVVVVLGADAERIKSTITSTRSTIAINEDWVSGLGTSIACGIQELNTTMGDCDGVLLMLADQPFIDVDYLNLLIQGFSVSNKKIIATNYNGKAGVPAILDKSYFPELLELKGDNGAKMILRSAGKDIEMLDPKNKTFDIDTLADYTKSQVRDH